MDQLSPPAPPPQSRAPDPELVAQRIEAWIDLMNTCEQLVLAGLRLKLGPEADIQAAYREWYRESMKEHDEMMFRMMRESSRAFSSDG